jgi:ribosome-binding protein aMBF1 (putative translation factor)
MEIGEEDLQRLAKQVGTRIQQIRKVAGLTQEQLEQKTNVYDVGLLERGEINPTLRNLTRDRHRARERTHLRTIDV